MALSNLLVQRKLLAFTFLNATLTLEEILEIWFNLVGEELTWISFLKRENENKLGIPKLQQSPIALA